MAHASGRSGRKTKVTASTWAAEWACRPWSRFVRPEGLVRRRYAMAPNSPKNRNGRSSSPRVRTSTWPA